MVKLGVNIDHVATIRQARMTYEPSPVEAARACERAGCDSIVCHLREDRRHINDADVAKLRKAVKTRLNLEMSIAPSIVRIACGLRPDQATLVPEKRREVTTEGGLDVVGQKMRIGSAVRKLARSGIDVSLFINPEPKQIAAAALTGARIIELHTGEYANASGAGNRLKELSRLKKAARYASSLGLQVNAGHGINYENVGPVARIRGMNELNIGHSIVSRAVFSGLGEAVRQMKKAIR